MSEEVKFYMEIPTGTVDEDGVPGLKEMEFTVLFSYQPDEYRFNGTHECWFIDGPIVDSDGKKWSENELNDIHDQVYDIPEDAPKHKRGVDWDDLANTAAEQYGERIADAKIEAYEARMEDADYY